jgi:ubiquinone/menaquinone biosynthesis C-methylase UbiE
MPLTLERQNAYRARYAQLMAGWQPATKVYETQIREHVQSPLRLLDVGCGRGGVLEQLTDLDIAAHGVDPDLASLREYRLPSVARAVASAEALPFPSDYFDMVISAWVLEHLPHPAQTFSEVGRVLRQGGVFIFLAPNKHSPIALLNRTLKPLQQTLVPLLYGRAEADTFPVVYRANTERALQQLTQQADLHLLSLQHIHDPTYLAFHEGLFRLNVFLTRWLPAWMGVHLVGVARKR